MTITPNVNLYFDVDAKQVSVKDSTSWPTINGTPVSEILNLKGLGTLTSPSSGVVFSVTNPSSPLIDIADGAQNSQSYNLPVTSGNIVVGTYTLAYTASGGYTQTALPTEVISNLGYVDFEDEELAAFLLQAGDVVTISGSATAGNNGTWTVVSAEANNGYSRVYLNASFVTDLTATGEITYTITRSYATNLSPAYTGCSKVTPSITFVSQPYTGEFGTLVVTDTTDYGDATVEDKTLSVLYPDGLFPAPETNPVVGTNVTSVTLLQVATGTYTITLDGTVVVAPVSGLGFTYSIAGIRVNGRPVNVFERVVIWNGDLCSIYSCISIVFDKHNRFVLQGQESPYTAAVADLSLAINRYLIAVQCGVQDDITSAFADINTILQSTDCNCGCDTENNNPVWISNSSQEGENLITQLQDEIDTVSDAVSSLTESVNTLQGQVNDLENAAVAVYVADFSQPSGATISIERVISNTLGLSPTFNYPSTGIVQVLTAGLTPVAKTSVTFQKSPSVTSPSVIEIEKNNASTITLYGFNALGALANQTIFGTITITVYP
jgi:hypothetical protein